VREAAGEGEDGGAGEASRWVGAFLGTKRIKVDRVRKRAELVGRLEALMGALFASNVGGRVTSTHSWEIEGRLVPKTA